MTSAIVADEVLQQADSLIAASAVTHGVRLATANVKDFPMAELTVEHWPHEAPTPGR